MRIPKEKCEHDWYAEKNHYGDKLRIYRKCGKEEIIELRRLRWLRR